MYSSEPQQTAGKGLDDCPRLALASERSGIQECPSIVGGVLEVFPTVRTNPLRAKSLFAAASPKSDLWIIVNILLKTRLFRLINNSSSSL
jgi:hypothetical protein